jgi:hypothetical protein
MKGGNDSVIIYFLIPHVRDHLQVQLSHSYFSTLALIHHTTAFSVKLSALSLEPNIVAKSIYRLVIIGRPDILQYIIHDADGNGAIRPGWNSSTPTH